MSTFRFVALVLVLLWIPQVHAETEVDGGEVGLFLPETLYACPELELNVYFDNIVLVLNTANYHFDVHCAKGMQLADRWTYTPAEDDTGSYSFAVEVRNVRNEIIARTESTIVVGDVPVDANRAYSVMLIGDSLTHAGIYSEHLLDLGTEAAFPGIALVGSHAPKEESPENRHEGYGGWTAQAFAKKYTGVAREGYYRDRGSPFLYEGDDGAPVLDFKRYCDDVNGGVSPDVVTIFLGCNDTFSATDENIDEVIEAILRHMDSLIEMIRRDAPDALIGLIAPVPPAASQDAFGANYKNGQTRWQYKRNQHTLVQAMHAHYGGREADGVTLIPAFVNLDSEHGYPAVDVAVNARNDQRVTRQNNSVHPSAAGYRQIGDSIMAWLVNQGE